jgi:hypothetical protein
MTEAKLAYHFRKVRKSNTFWKRRAKMKTISTRFPRALRTGLLAVAAIAVAGAATAPAFADEWRHDRGFRHEDRRDHERFEHRGFDHDRVFAYPYRPYAYVAPGYYAPYVNFGFAIR